MTESQLRRIIREELSRASPDPDMDVNAVAAESISVDESLDGSRVPCVGWCSCVSCLEDRGIDPATYW